MKRPEYIELMSKTNNPLVIDLRNEIAIMDSDISIADLGKIFEAGEKRKQELKQPIKN